MYFAAILPVISALSSLSFAQSINPDNVPLAIRQQWCTTQKTSCPLLCLQYPGNNAGTTSNNCDATTLDYSCVCWNNQSPNASQYSQTIPYFECTESNNECVANCGQDSTCQNACRANNPCGAQSPTRVNTSTISSTMSKTATGSSGSSATGAAATSQFATLGSGSQPTGGSGKGSNASGKSGASGLVLDMGKGYGLAVVLGGVFAGFALLL